LNQVKWRQIRFLVNFTSCRSEDKGLNRSFLKKQRRARSGRPTQPSAGLAQLVTMRAGAGGPDCLAIGARRSAAGATEPLRSDAVRRIKSESTNQVHRLRVTGPSQTETLGGSGRRGCSPRGIPRTSRRRWGDAVDDGDLREGRHDRKASRGTDLHGGNGEVFPGDLWSSTPTFLGQKRRRDYLGMDDRSSNTQG
jgi:hypothetical protein